MQEGARGERERGSESQRESEQESERKRGEIERGGARERARARDNLSCHAEFCLFLKIVIPGSFSAHVHIASSLSHTSSAVSVQSNIMCVFACFCARQCLSVRVVYWVSVCVPVCISVCLGSNSGVFFCKTSEGICDL